MILHKNYNNDTVINAIEIWLRIELFSIHVLSFIKPLLFHLIEIFYPLPIQAFITKEQRYLNGRFYNKT